MKRISVVFAIMLLAVLFIAGCAMSGYEGDYSGYPRDPAPGSSTGDGMGSGSGEGGSGQVEIPAGQLTAGEWCDLENPEFWKALIGYDASQAEDNQISEATNQFRQLDKNSTSLLPVKVTSDGKPVFNARVEVFNSGENQEVLSRAFTDVLGRAYLFPGEGYEFTVKASIASPDNSDVMITSSVVVARDEVDFYKTVEIELEGVINTPVSSQLMLVVDTTGSMSDELEYIEAEIKDVIKRVDANNPNGKTEVALLFYRDAGDQYVTKYYDFTTDMNAVYENISLQMASGGGDIPEAVDIAFEKAMAAQWRFAATKLIMHVADAPHHFDNAEANERYFKAIESAREQGIRIVTVASSGIDLTTELLMRQHCMLTGGTYVFLTNHSGIGNDHLEPTVGAYTIEYLNDCLVRVAMEYLLGIEIEPVPYDQQQQ